MVKVILELYSVPKWNINAYISNKLKTSLLAAFQYFDLKWSLDPFINKSIFVVFTKNLIHFINNCQTIKVVHLISYAYTPVLKKIMYVMYDLCETLQAGKQMVR